MSNTVKIDGSKKTWPKRLDGTEVTFPAPEATADANAVLAFLTSHGIKFVDSIPPELYPGIDYSAIALDPDGHCIQLYYYMEQIGWDGKPRPASQRRQVSAEVATNPSAWPEALEPLSDTYVDQTYQGPLG
jgi:hypothetical protein